MVWILYFQVVQVFKGTSKAPGLIERIVQFFTRLWSPKSNDAEKLGWAYAYDEDGSLLGEYGMGGAASAGQSQFLYLPTASGPLPIAADIDGSAYAIHTDHLGTPRRLTQADGQAAWQWAYTPYGDEAPTLGAKRFTSEATTPTTGGTSIPPVRFNLRYPGQYFDEESGLHYNYFRSYNPATGRYTQADPIGLSGGWNRFSYVDGNPLNRFDPDGLRWVCIVPLGCTWHPDPPPGDPDLPEPPPITFPNPFKPIVDFIDRCMPSREKNCEALRQSILNTCASLSGRKKSRCVAAANESYRQCMSE